MSTVKNKRDNIVFITRRDLSSLHSFGTYLLSTYCVPHTVGGTGDPAVNSPHGLSQGLVI